MAKLRFLTASPGLQATCFACSRQHRTSCSFCYASARGGTARMTLLLRHVSSVHVHADANGEDWLDAKRCMMSCMHAWPCLGDSWPQIRLVAVGMERMAHQEVRQGLPVLAEAHQLCQSLVYHQRSFSTLPRVYRVARPAGLGRRGS